MTLWAKIIHFSTDFDFHMFYCSLTLNVTYWRPPPTPLTWTSPIWSHVVAPSVTWINESVIWNYLLVTKNLGKTLHTNLCSWWIYKQLVHKQCRSDQCSLHVRKVFTTRRGRCTNTHFTQWHIYLLYIYSLWREKSSLEYQRLIFTKQKRRGLWNKLNPVGVTLLTLLSAAV